MEAVCYAARFFCRNYEYGYCVVSPVVHNGFSEQVMHMDVCVCVNKINCSPPLFYHASILGYIGHDNSMRKVFVKFPTSNVEINYRKKSL
jgi:hypothetical protein